MICADSAKNRGTMRFARSVGIAACAALAACASHRAPDERLPAAFEAPAGGTATPAAALDNWWTAFGDPELSALIEKALADSPDARTAQAKLREARGVRSSGVAQLLPQGNLRGSKTETHSKQLSGDNANIPGFSSSGVSTITQANFDVSWELDVFLRTLTARKILSSDLAAARFNYEATRASLAAQVADSYFAARGLAIQLEDARETVRIQTSLMNVLDRRAERGIAATSEADRVASDLAQAQAQAAGLEAELQAASRSLLILTGRGIEPTANAPIQPVVGVIPEVPAGVPSDLLIRRPDVREARERLASAVGYQSIAARAFLPTFTLEPGVGWRKTEQPGFGTTVRSWSIGGSVMQPILDIPKLIADLHVRKAQTEQAIIAYEKTLQTAFGEAENAMAQLAADRRRVVLLTDGEMRGRRAFDAARKRYDLGIDDLPDLLSAEQSWRTTRSQLTAARVQGLRRAVQSYKALGGGWPSQSLPPGAKAR
jgi:NodT family efflux transporter outer membrane factor (OMF) lipoprotein